MIVSSIMGANGAISRSMLGLLPRIAYSIIAAVSLNLVVGFLGELRHYDKKEKFLSEMEDLSQMREKRI